MVAEYTHITHILLYTEREKNDKILCIGPESKPCKITHFPNPSLITVPSTPSVTHYSNIPRAVLIVNALLARLGLRRRLVFYHLSCVCVYYPVPVY